MPISRISVFCLAFFVNLGFSADVIAGSPPSAAAKQSGFQRAYDLFEAGDYRGAAKSFDQLFADFADETFLHYAALSWATAGDDTRAILRWRHLLADPQLASPLEKEARSYLEGAYLRTVTLSIKISPARALLPTSKIILERQEDGKSGESLSLTHKELKGAQDPDHAGFQLHVRPGIWRLRVSDVHPGYESPPVEVEAQPKVNTVDNDNSQDEVNAIDIVLVLQPRVGELQLSLDLPAQRTRPLEFVLEDAEGIEAPKQASILSEQLTQALRVGRWRYELRDPEFGVVDRGSVEIHEGETYELHLNLGSPELEGPMDTERPPKDRLRTRLGLSLGGGGLGFLVGGLAWIPYRQADSVAEFFAEGSTAPPAKIIASHERMVESLIFIGSGVGIEIGALSVLLGIEDRGLAIEAGVGSAAFAGGLALVLSGGVCLDKTPYIAADRLANEAKIRSCRSRDFAGGPIVGSGAGLLTSSAIALLTRALVKRHQGRQDGGLKIRANVEGTPGQSFSLGITGSF